jgi:hypothetical protein
MTSMAQFPEAKPGLSTNVAATFFRWSPLSAAMWAAIIYGVSRLARIVQ